LNCQDADARPERILRKIFEELLYFLCFRQLYLPPLV
jgi:hypothetical protein